MAALYATNALSLIRLARIMLGNRAAAEDVVQEAFCGLYRRWHHLSDTCRAPGYLRTSVLNGCRSLPRQGQTQELGTAREPVVSSAESAVLASEEGAAVVRALRKLPDRHREVLVLRYYLELPDHQIAADLEIGPITVRSARRRALASLRRLAELKVTATGAVLGRIGAPGGYQGYVAVSGAASDRSFVLAAQTPLVPVRGHGPQTLGERTKFYLLTIDPAARAPERRLRLTALPIPVLPPWDVYQKLALSPDGSRLAVLLGTPEADTFPAAQQLSVYSLANGTVRSRVIYSLNFPMSWQADSRTLGVIGSLQPLRTHPRGWSPRYSYLLIDTASPNPGLAGRATFPVSNSLHLRWYAATLTADGRTVIGSVNDNPSAKWAPAVTDNPGYDLLVAYNARTGRREAVIRRLPTAPGGTGLNTSYVLWSDSSGRVMVIVTGPYRKHPEAGIYSGGRFIPLPIASGTSPSDSAW
ncbi:MAG: RNA polymerase sigma factor [Streptosporangiaceae bacterium]